MKMQNIMKTLLVTAILAHTSFVNADEPQPAETKVADMLVYMLPQEYNNPIKLWQYYKDYWFTQGPLVEGEAKQALGAEFGDVGMCDNNQIAGKALVWLRPRMFYNPQIQTYYGSVIAVVYNANGKPIGSYGGEAKKTGFLDVYPEKQITGLYKQAMQIVASKMKADANLQAALSTPLSSNEGKTPCSMVSLLPAPKIQFMSF